MEKKTAFPCKYCQRTFRNSKTMLAHLCLKVAELPCRYCNTMFTTDCACKYHLEVCSAKPADVQTQRSPAADAISLGTLRGGTSSKSEPMRSPIRLRESPVKVQRLTPQKNGMPETKRLRTESASPQKRNLPETAPPPVQNTPQPPQPEIITLDDDDENMENNDFVEKENKLALILLSGNEEETYCPICESHFENIERHGRSHGMAFLKYCAMRREKMTAKCQSQY